MFVCSVYVCMLMHGYVHACAYVCTCALVCIDVHVFMHVTGCV